MSYEINPCKAVRQKLHDSDCDINTMNDLCYGISRAYRDVYGDDVGKSLDKSCADLISEKKCSNQQTDCYMKRPSPPLIFNNIPHFFPKLLKESNKPRKSYEKCCSMCDNSRYPNTCKENCRTDADAVVMKPHNYRKDNESYKESYKESDYKDVNPVLFFMGYGVVIVMIVILVWFLIVRYNKLG